MADWNVSVSLEFMGDFMRLPRGIATKTWSLLDRMRRDPWTRELQPEKVKSAEPGVHSSRVDDKYRLIWKHIKPNDIVFFLVDKHDNAYRRAARKSFKLEGGVVRVADIVVEGAKRTEGGEGSLFGWGRAKDQQYGSLFVGYKDQELFELGVPQDILPNIRALDNLNQMENIERLLPEEIFDRLLAIAIGHVDRPVVRDDILRKSLVENQGGDELYRFVSSEEFKRALAGDMEEWMLFLAPAQKQLMLRDYQGPARVKGVAGSGKTVVAIHRARHMAIKASGQEKKVLFLTFGNRLPGIIRHLLSRLAGVNAPEIAAVECVTIHQWCARFIRNCGLDLNVVSDFQGKTLLNEAISQERGNYPSTSLWRRSDAFFADEIRFVIKGRDVRNLDEYLDLDRGGRGTPLQESERRAMFAVYQVYQQKLEEQHICDYDDFILKALRLVEEGCLEEKYTCAVVDEIQDLTEATMKLIRAIIPEGSNDLFLVGDGLQRIYAGGYSLGRLGIEVVGRGTLLRRNYRNTQEILRAAYAMMSDCNFDDLDEDQSEVTEPEYSVRRGETPQIHRFSSPEEELKWIKTQINTLIEEEKYLLRDFVLLYRYKAPYQELIQQLLSRDFEIVELTKNPETYFGPGLKHTTFHSAKGIEFKVVFVVGVADGQFVPRDDWTLEDKALEEYLSREQRLLYVAMTRARDRLYLTYSRGQPSRFLNSVDGNYLIRVK